MTSNDIICSDALEGIKSVKSKSVNFVLTDPPYNISEFTDKKNNMMKGGYLYKYKYCDLVIAKWDFKSMDPEVCKEMYRVLKPGGAVACFYDVWKMGQLRESFRAAKFHQFRVCEWEKNNPTPINSKRNYLSNAKEFFLYCVKGWRPTFNSKYDNGTYKSSLCHPPERKHPAQKPLTLFKEIILKHTNHGDTVLDCYAGAGTTAVACASIGRNSINFEVDETYCKIAEERLRPAVNSAQSHKDEEV